MLVGQLALIVAAFTGAAFYISVAEQPARLKLDDLGDLTYGIYLNHFLVATSLLWIAEIYGAPVFGRYNDPAFGAIAAIACALLATATLHLVERPVERLRRLIKKQTSLEPAAERSLPIQASPAA